ncbi:MAG TPA: hypothetical protein VGC56_06750 [Allosphingosinicella sp.]|jgi:predicted phage terminase large subunit-like protein
MLPLPNFDEYDAITRTDFNVFVERVFVELNGSATYLDNFHIAAMVSELEKVRRHETRRLAIALPPRSLKSLVVSVAYSAWVLGHDPSAKIICASYGQQLADDLARDCRQVMESGWYKRLFRSARLRADRRAVAAFETTAGGYRHSTSVGGVVTGFGADIIIVDDPTKPEEAISDVERAKANAWASHTLFTRLNDKVNGAIVIVMQRLHEDDMIGHVGRVSDLKLVSFPAIAQQDEEHVLETPFGSWRHLRAEGEALHPNREPVGVLEEIRRAIGNQHFDGQYLQTPSPPGGRIVKPEWFQKFDLASQPQFDQVVQSWDTASKAKQLADYSVCTTWGKRGKHIFLLHVLRERLEYPELKRRVISQANIFAAQTVLIEDASSGIALIQDLKSDGFYKARAVKPKGEKTMRMNAQPVSLKPGWCPFRRTRIGSRTTSTNCRCSPPAVTMIRWIRRRRRLSI